MAVTSKQVRALADKIRVQLENLQELIYKKQEALDNAESRDYPNEERIDLLSDQVDILQSAYDDLENAIEPLENYE